MEGTLQELVDIYAYRDIDTKEPKCEIYFKGKFEAFDCVNAGQLFGDLVEISIAQRQADLLRDLPEGLDREDVFFLFDELPEHSMENNPDNVLYVAEVIFDCNWEYSAFAEEKVLSFLRVLDENKILFSKETFDAFVYSYSVYIPPCRRCEFVYSNVGNLQEKVKMMFEGLSFAEEAMLRTIYHTSKSDIVYHYDCDTLQEILMSLLHYFALESLTIKRCEQCGRWFVPANKSDEKYCTRNLSGKTCKELSTIEKRRNRINQNPLIKKYNSASTNLANRANASNISDQEREQRLRTLYKLREDWPKRRKEMDEKSLFEWLDTFKVGGINNA